METCQRCEEAAARQAEAMAPRKIREGYAVVLSLDALRWRNGELTPDIRVGDVVRVILVGGAVPDMPYCEKCEGN